MVIIDFLYIILKISNFGYIIYRKNREIGTSYWYLPKQYIQERFIGKSIDESFMDYMGHRELESFIGFISKYLDK